MQSSRLRMLIRGPLGASVSLGRTPLRLDTCQDDACRRAQPKPQRGSRHAAGGTLPFPPQMERPSEHGGGRRGPAIAGDPTSFPSDAELARTLTAGQRQATLCTLTADGYPYGSVVSYAVDGAGAPLMLISELAEHTANARGDDRVSPPPLLVAAAAPRDGDPLGSARLTLLGRLRLVDDPATPRAAYLERHPYAAAYVDFTDFSFWRLEVEKCRFVGGFGHMSWVTANAYRDASVDPLAEEAGGIISHMNDDHADANLLYVTVLAQLGDASDAAMVGIDRYGATLRAHTPAGPRLARVPFPAPLQRADQSRAALIDLLQTARGQAAGGQPPE